MKNPLDVANEANPAPAACPWTRAWMEKMTAGRLSPAAAARARSEAGSTLRIAQHVAAPVATVFGAWLEPDVARRWLFATAGAPLVTADIDARVDGAFYLVARHGDTVIEHRGVYVDIVANRSLSFTLRSGSRRAPVGHVAIDFAARPRGCAVTLVHAGVAPDLAGTLRLRWTGILFGLDATLRDAGLPPGSHR